jgi:hypothetical protein
VYHLQTRLNTAGGSIGEEHIAMVCGLVECTIGVANTWPEAQQMQVCGGSSRCFGVVNVSKVNNGRQHSYGYIVHSQQTTHNCCSWVIMLSVNAMK